MLSYPDVVAVPRMEKIISLINFTDTNDPGGAPQCVRKTDKANKHVYRHACTVSMSIHSCLLCPIFSCSSAHMPSAGLIKAAPSCCHRNGPAHPLASPSAGCPNHSQQSGSTAVGQVSGQVEHRDHNPTII